MASGMKWFFHPAWSTNNTTLISLRQDSNQGPLAWQSRVLTNTLSSQEGNSSNFEGEYQHLALGKCISFEIEAVVVASASAFLA